MLMLLSRFFLHSLNVYMFVWVYLRFDARFSHLILCTRFAVFFLFCRVILSVFLIRFSLSYIYIFNRLILLTAFKSSSCYSLSVGVENWYQKSCIINHRQFQLHALIIFERMANWWVPVDSSTPKKHTRTQNSESGIILRWKLNGITLKRCHIFRFFLER